MQERYQIFMTKFLLQINFWLNLPYGFFSWFLHLWISLNFAYCRSLPEYAFQLIRKVKKNKNWTRVNSVSIWDYANQAPWYDLWEDLEKLYLFNFSWINSWWWRSVNIIWMLTACSLNLILASRSLNLILQHSKDIYG